MYEKKFIATDSDTPSKYLNNFVKQSFADFKQNMIIFLKYGDYTDLKFRIIGYFQIREKFRCVLSRHDMPLFYIDLS